MSLSAFKSVVEEGVIIQALVAFVFLFLLVVGIFSEKFKRLEKRIDELEEKLKESKQLKER